MGVSATGSVPSQPFGQVFSAMSSRKPDVDQMRDQCHRRAAILASGESDSPVIMRRPVSLHGRKREINRLVISEAIRILREKVGMASHCAASATSSRRTLHSASSRTMRGGTLLPTR